VTKITGFLPNLSDNGPKTRPLKLMVIKKAEIVRLTSSTDVFNCPLMDGIAGRYMSVASMGKAESMDINSIIIPLLNCPGVLLFCFISDSSVIQYSDLNNTITYNSAAGVSLFIFMNNAFISRLAE
jgi:hypothetical protein